MPTGFEMTPFHGQYVDIEELDVKKDPELKPYISFEGVNKKHCWL